MDQTMSTQQPTSPPGAATPPHPTGAMSTEMVMTQLAQAVSQLAMATSSGSSSAAHQQWKETRFIKSPDVYAPRRD